MVDAVGVGKDLAASVWKGLYVLTGTYERRGPQFAIMAIDDAVSQIRLDRRRLDAAVGAARREAERWVWTCSGDHVDGEVRLCVFGEECPACGATA